jgi:hypothetical protein
MLKLCEFEHLGKIARYMAQIRVQFEVFNYGQIFVKPEALGHVADF